ncbi:MAG: hypothetical protein JXR63_06465 [Spirochaetales bacterium]|nr:hypothetical protein [Spirochaetales bacterium]
MFYLECKDYIDEEIIYDHISSCSDKSFNEMSDFEKNRAKILYTPCKSGDFKTYAHILNSYLDYLYEMILELIEIVKSERDIRCDEMLFGYFCFEIHSE